VSKRHSDTYRTRSGSRPCLLFLGTLGTLVLLLLQGCVTPRTTATETDFAVLEVTNRTQEALWLEIRGRFETTLPPSSRTNIRYLAVGEAQVQAYSEKGRVAAAAKPETTYRSSLILEGGKTTSWAVGTEVPLSAIKGLGSIQMKNTLARDVQVTLNQRPLGTLLSGDSRIFRDIPAGEYICQASDRTLKTVIDHMATVQTGSVSTWEIKQKVGRVTIINDTEEAVDFVLNNEALGRISADSRRTFKGIPPGQHEIVGTSAITRHRYQNILEITPGETFTWGLKTGSGSLTVVNHTDEKLTVVPRGTLVPTDARTLEIEPGAKQSVPNVQPGLMTLHAVGDRQQILYSTQAKIRKGQHFIWDVFPRAATGRVTNGTQQTTEIFVAGKRQGSLSPNEALTLGDLPSGDFHLRAYDSNGQMYEQFVPQIPRKPLTWRISSQLGTVRIKNQRKDTLSVFRNGRFIGEVPPQETITFTGIPVGKQLFEAVDARSNDVTRHWIHVSTEAATELAIAVQRCTLSVRNDSSEVLVVNGIWAQQIESIAAGSEVQFMAGPGAKTLSLRGRTSGLHFIRSFELTTGANAAWTIAKPVGNIRVLNELSESLAVGIDDEPTLAVEAGGFHDFVGIPAGIHRLKAVGLTSGRLYRENRRIQPDGHTVWRLARERARLLVRNHDQSDILIELDGRPYGVVFGGSSKIFAGLDIGLRSLRSVALNNHSIRRHEISLNGGRTDVVDIHPSRGTVVVENVSGEDVRITIDHAVWPMKIGQTPTEFPVDAGLRLVRVTRRDSQSETLYRVNVRPWRSIHLRVGKPTARISVKNGTKRTLSVLIGDRELGTVGPGEELIGDQLRPGSVKLLARELTGKISHIENRTIRAGSTSLWHLQ
jgi:hypothetical protein